MHNFVSCQPEKQDTDHAIRKTLRLITQSDRVLQKNSERTISHRVISAARAMKITMTHPAQIHFESARTNKLIQSGAGVIHGDREGKSEKNRQISDSIPLCAI